MVEFLNSLMTFLTWIAPFASAVTIVVALGGLIEWRLRRFEARSSERFTSLEVHLAAGLSRIDATNARIDTLYQMFVDLLRESKKEKAKVK